MSEAEIPKPGGKIDRKTPAPCPQKSTIVWEGRPIPMLLEPRGWRARKRSAALSVDVTAPTRDLALAKKLIRDELDRRKAAPPTARRSKPVGTLRALCDAYLAAPKRCSAAVAEANVARLATIVRATWGKELAEAPLADLPGLWPAYVAKRQGLQVPDYNTRRACNAGINSAMRLARSILIDSLRPAYAAAGIVLPPESANVMWTAELHSVRPAASDADMISAWRALPVASSLWWVIGLARFAGLRRSEILAARGKWMVERGGLMSVELRDRPEDGYWTKTGRPYSALVMDPDLASALSGLAPDAMVLAEPEAGRWIEREPQEWLKAYVGAARLPLHRLRGLYADHVRQETEQAILARQAAIKAASLALGHSSTAVTEKSYLDPGMGGAS